MASETIPAIHAKLRWIKPDTLRGLAIRLKAEGLFDWEDDWPEPEVFEMLETDVAAMLKKVAPQAAV